MKRKSREYDNVRKANTLVRLHAGFDELKARNPKQVITKYALSKHTGIARQTIASYPEIMKLLEAEQDLKYKVDTIDGVKTIKSLNDVKKLAARFEGLLKEKDSKLNELLKINTSLNLKIVQLTDENRKLKSIIERYERAVKDAEIH